MVFVNSTCDTTVPLQFRKHIIENHPKVGKERGLKTDP